MPVAIWLITRGTNEISNHQLAVAAAATGGLHYRALSDRAIRTRVGSASGANSTHSIFRLSAVVARADGGFHEIKVTVTRPEIVVRTRLGYFVVAAGDANAPATQ